MVEMSGTDEDIDTIWTAAVEAWSAGDMPLAFPLCQAMVPQGSDSAEHHGLMASIAIGLRRYAKARDYLDAAARRAPASGAKPKYLTIQPWGCGFWGEVDHVLCQLAVAEITGRNPLVHWSAQGAYGARGFQNSWETYFQPVSEVRLADLRRKELSLFPIYWQIGDLDRTSVERGRPHDQAARQLPTAAQKHRPHARSHPALAYSCRLAEA